MDMDQLIEGIEMNRNKNDCLGDLMDELMTMDIMNLS